MVENQTNARWIAIIGGVVALSTCAACMLLTVLLTSAYGGETIRLRNPFAPPQQSVASGGGAATNGENTGPTGGNTSGGNTSGGNTSGGNTSGGNTSGGNTSGGGATGGNAANYLPSLTGYTAADASSITGALDLVLGSDFGAQSAGGDEAFSAQSLSGIATTLLVSRLDEFIECYRQTGAVDARVYVRANLATLTTGNVPPLGAVVVANEDRLRESLVACAVSPNDPNSFSAQSANQPCGNFGSFRAAGERLVYVYAGTTTDFCTAVETHFSGFGG